MSKVIVHRPFDGNHNTDSDDCWCRPVEIDPDDARDIDEVIAEVEAETNRCDG